MTDIFDGDNQIKAFQENNLSNEQLKDGVLAKGIRVGFQSDDGSVIEVPVSIHQILLRLNSALNSMEVAYFIEHLLVGMTLTSLDYLNQKISAEYSHARKAYDNRIFSSFREWADNWVAKGYDEFRPDHLKIEGWDTPEVRSVRLLALAASGVIEPRYEIYCQNFSRGMNCSSRYGSIARSDFTRKDNFKFRCDVCYKKSKVNIDYCHIIYRIVQKQKEADTR